MASAGTREIRARHTDETVRVYQAFCPQIAEPALRAGTFVPPFGMGRMTWIKPSLNWMRYRAGDATKPNQERILAIDITREGFDWALENADLSHFVPEVHASREDWARRVESSLVRVQWDPERDIDLQPLPDVRAIQIGLRGRAVEAYVKEWIVGLADITAMVHPATRSRDAIAACMAEEAVYPMSARAATALDPRL